MKARVRPRATVRHRFPSQMAPLDVPRLGSPRPARPRGPSRLGRRIRTPRSNRPRTTPSSGCQDLLDGCPSIAREQPRPSETRPDEPTRNPQAPPEQHPNGTVFPASQAAVLASDAVRRCLPRTPFFPLAGRSSRYQGGARCRQRERPQLPQVGAWRGPRRPTRWVRRRRPGETGGCRAERGARTLRSDAFTR